MSTNVKKEIEDGVSIETVAKTVLSKRGNELVKLLVHLKIENLN